MPGTLGWEGTEETPSSAGRWGLQGHPALQGQGRLLPVTSRSSLLELGWARWVVGLGSRDMGGMPLQPYLARPGSPSGAGWQEGPVHGTQVIVTLLKLLL